MQAQKWFIILISIFVVSSVAWYLMFYEPLGSEIQKTENKLSALNQQMRNVRQAERKLDHVEQKLEKSKEELSQIKSRFVNRDNLSYVTKKLREMALKYNLEIEDFSPVLDSYFEESGNDRVKALPIALTVIGRYLDIGKYIQNLEQLDFYLIPMEINIDKKVFEKNDLSATITCNLYTWNR